MSATIEVPGVGDVAGDAAAEGRQFVTFHVRDELFGVPLAEVQEIIRMPELVQVPLCPPSLKGIANLRGAVLPVTSLRQVFGEEEAAQDDATRVVVMNRGGFSAGFVVDRMARVITAEAEEIETAEAIEATIRSDLLRGIVKRADGLIMLLEPARLAMLETKAADRPCAGLTLTGPAERPRADTATVDEIQLVSFEAAGQEYAFPIEDVREIVQVPAGVMHVPNAQPHVVAVMTLRDRLLPLVSLRRMFGLPEAKVDEHSRIVVIAPAGQSAGQSSASVGIIMDTVKEVLRVNRGLTDPVPALLTGGEGAGSAFESICRLDGGKRLVTIQSADRMFRDTALRAAIAMAAEHQAVQGDAMADSQSPTEAADDEEQFVVFRLSGEEYGVPIGTVQEIVRIPEELTKVPKAASFTEGLINLRGTVLPVVDQRRRFALEDAVRNDRQRIMVLTIGGIRTGFIVDQVSEVLKIPRSAIEPAPALSEEQARLIRRVANLESRKRMVLLLDPTDLLNASELRALETD